MRAEVKPYQHITLTFHQNHRGESFPQVGFLRLNRPHVHNAFHDEMIQEMQNALWSIGKENTENPGSLRLLVMSGEGPSFSAGADLQWMKRMAQYTYEENVSDARQLQNLFFMLNQLEIPLLTVVEGNAFGGGVGLLAVADEVIALKSLKFSFSEVKLGLSPAVISPFVFQKIGGSFTRSLFLSGRVFSSEEARMMGLIHHISEDSEELFKILKKRIGEYLEGAPEAVIATKKLCHLLNAHTFGNDLGKSLHHETVDLISKRRISKEGQEGMASLLQKSTPSWKLQNFDNDRKGS